MNAALLMNINELRRYLPMAEAWLMNINEQALAVVAFVNSRFTGESPERERRSVGGLRNCEREEISHHLLFLTASTENGGTGFFVFNLQIPVWLLFAVRVVSVDTGGPSTPAAAFGVSAGIRLSEVSVWRMLRGDWAGYHLTPHGNAHLNIIFIIKLLRVTQVLYHLNCSLLWNITWYCNVWIAWINLLA